MSLTIENIIEGHKIRDWALNQDVLKKMENAIDDYLFELRNTSGLPLTTEDMDAVLERCLGAARKQAGV